MMRKNNIIKTIDQMINDVNGKWVRLAHYQGTNAEQTNSAEFFLVPQDFRLSNNESDHSPYDEMSIEDLIFLNATLAFKIQFFKPMCYIFVDTFGDDAQVKRCIIPQSEEVDCME